MQVCFCKHACTVSWFVQQTGLFVGFCSAAFTLVQYSVQQAHHSVWLKRFLGKSVMIYCLSLFFLFPLEFWTRWRIKLRWFFLDRTIVCGGIQVLSEFCSFIFFRYEKVEDHLWILHFIYTRFHFRFDEASLSRFPISDSKFARWLCQINTSIEAAMEVCFLISGQGVALLDTADFGKLAKAVKQTLATKMGIFRFRQKLFLQGYFYEIPRF